MYARREDLLQRKVQATADGLLDDSLQHTSHRLLEVIMVQEPPVVEDGQVQSSVPGVEDCSLQQTRGEPAIQQANHSVCTVI